MEPQELKSRLWETLKKTRDERFSFDTGEGGEATERTAAPPDDKPIEPEGSRVSGIARLKWVFFALALLYILGSAYRVPILTSMGRYLVVEHTPEKSDLIVCLGGGNVERGLTAADVYRGGLAPRILVPRETIPDGYDILRRRGVSYPESRDLMVLMLKGLDVPESAILKNETPSESTVEEAALATEVAKNNNFRSILVVTSPPHTRRAWLVFRKAMQGEGIRILIVPSSYSNFKADEWWQSGKYAKEVLLEYQKLIYYYFKDFI